MLAAVEAVYASRRQAAPYRHAHGLDEEQIMAVIIQELIPADCAGVGLAVDPVALRADQLAINAVWGMGAGVMEQGSHADLMALNGYYAQLVRTQAVTGP